MRTKQFLGKFVSFWSFVAIAYASYLLLVLSLPYIHFEKNVEFLLTKQLIYHIKLWRISFYIHVFTSPLIIVSGLLQFNRWLLRKKPIIHKSLGYTYLLTLLLLSGPSALIMSFYANGGRIAQASFVLLTTLWLLSTVLALIRIKQGNIQAHVKWMIRSYALTLSAVTLRFYAYLFDVFNLKMDPESTYILLAFLSWIPNLLFAELLIRLQYPSYLLKGKRFTEQPR